MSLKNGQLAHTSSGMTVHERCAARFSLLTHAPSEVRPMLAAACATRSSTREASLMVTWRSRPRAVAGALTRHPFQRGTV